MEMLIDFIKKILGLDRMDYRIRRLERVNPEKLIFKFSDGDNFEPEMAKRFDALSFKNKVLFTASEFPGLKSAITLEKFRGTSRVHDEWKNSSQEFNVAKFINTIHENENIQ